tara:strand:- start:618 stop:1472 length:855 start_codon:yes stop_codon:yes gene_type:complete
MISNQQIHQITLESLRDWFKKEKWVRISSSGNIAGPCGTSKNKKNPDRCLPRAKAQSLTKAQRAATARKKKKAGAKGKTVVKNTKKATVRKEQLELPSSALTRINSDIRNAKTMAQSILQYIDAVDDKESPAIFTNPKLRRALELLKDLGDDDDKDAVTGPLNFKDEVQETANPQDGKAAPYGSGFKPLTKEQIEVLLEKCWDGYQKKGMKTMFGKRVPNCVKKEDFQNLVVGLINEAQGKEVLMEKDDRCTRIAKRKYDTWPSAYASGAVVRCRRGDIWKKEK